VVKVKAKRMKRGKTSEPVIFPPMRLVSRKKAQGGEEIEPTQAVAEESGAGRGLGLRGFSSL
jgi:hypothetical protein